MNAMQDRNETQGLFFYSHIAVDVLYFDSQLKWLIHHYSHGPIVLSVATYSQHPLILLVLIFLIKTNCKLSHIDKL